MTLINKHFSNLPVVGLISFLFVAIFNLTASAAPVTGFTPGRIMDDDVFTAHTSMNPAQIQSFLNSKVPSCDTNGTQTSEFGGGTRAQWATARGFPPPYTCVKNYIEGGKSAAQIIYDVAQQFRINPQVLIVLLQKEQALITDTWPLSRQYRSATGYGCPDTAACDTQYYGFTNQVTWAARMFRSIMDASPSWYTPYVMGNNFIRFNPQASCGGTTVNIQTRATQALYNYTPYQPNQSALNAGYGTGDSCGAYGNRNFYLYFTDWFGGTLGNTFYMCRYSSNVGGAPSGVRVIPNQFTPGGNTRFSMVLMNNTGSSCIEVHTWGDSQQAWITNVGTNLPAVDPSQAEVINANIYGDSKDELVYVKYKNTGSGMIEVHTWDSTYQRWSSNVATNHPAVSLSDTRVIAADTNGDGRDELVFVKYQNTGSGMIEVHTWGQNQQSWISNVATNHPVIASGDFEAVAGNIYGGKPDEIALVKLRNTGSGRIEIHVWAPGQTRWLSNVATSVAQIP